MQIKHLKTGTMIFLYWTLLRLVLKKRLSTLVQTWNSVCLSLYCNRYKTFLGEDKNTTGFKFKQRNEYWKILLKIETCMEACSGYVNSSLFKSWCPKEIVKSTWESPFYIGVTRETSLKIFFSKTITPKKINFMVSFAMMWTKFKSWSLGLRLDQR